MDGIDAAVGRILFLKRTAIHKERVVDGCVVLHGKYKIKEELYRSAHEQVALIIDAMEPGQSYTSRDLCGETYWGGLKTAHKRRAVGLSLADMVRKGVLPLKFAGKKSNSWLYARE